MPLFSPELMKRKRNYNQLFKYFWRMLLSKKMWKFIIQLTLDNLKLKKWNSLNKSRLSHKLPSKQNYLLGKTFILYSITRTLIALSKFVSSLCLFSDLSYRKSTVAVPISFHYLASYVSCLAICKISFPFSWIGIQILL